MVKSQDEHVQYMIKNREQRREEEHKFALKHGLCYKRAQDYRNCLIIRWKTSTKPYLMNKTFYKRVDEYWKISHALSDKYNLNDENDIFLEEELKLFKIGILINYQSSYKLWAIPNEFKEIQEEVLSKLPKWAKATMKPNSSCTK